MNELLLQIPVIGMEVEQFLLLLITPRWPAGRSAPRSARCPHSSSPGSSSSSVRGWRFSNRGIASSAASDVGYVSVTGVIGFGAITGPHIAFAGGVAASAYAAKKYPEMKPGEGGYHFGKGITYAFGTKPDILAVGAIFGVIGMLFTQLANGLFSNVLGMSPPPTSSRCRCSRRRSSPGPSSATRSSGSRPAMDTSICRRSSAMRCTRRPTPTGSTPVDRPPNRGSPPVQVVGDHGHWTRRRDPRRVHLAADGSIFLGYAISAISLLFLNLGVEKIPVTHHITLLGAVGAVAVDPVAGSVVALLAAGIFGVLSGLAGEVTQRLFYSHSGTHVDPPAMAIAIMMLLVWLLSILGVLPNAGTSSADCGDRLQTDPAAARTDSVALPNRFDRAAAVVDAVATQLYAHMTESLDLPMERHTKCDRPPDRTDSGRASHRFYQSTVEGRP